LGQEGGGRHAAVLVGRRQGIGGSEGRWRWQVCCCVVGAATLLRCEGSGGHGLAGAALPGQEGSGDGIDYINEDGGQHHKRGRAGENNKQ
jgi:hypothetical protein